MRRLLRWVFIAGGLGGLGWLIARMLRSSEAPAPEPAPVVAPVTATAPDDAEAPEPEPQTTTWVRPDGDACPASHPVKAKEASGIYHVPGGLSYDRTVADRCYASEEAAQADGYRKAKR